MELYTSLVRLKQSMNDGELPPMTPVPASSLDLIDGAFTIGFGGLTEDQARGLRCPIRGCGRFFHVLGSHIVRSHPETSVAEVKRKLSIPPGARLVSRTQHAKASARATERGWVPRGRLPSGASAQQRSARAKRRNYATVGAKNLRNSCMAQLSHKLIDLHNDLGRSPSTREAQARLGGDIVHDVIATFGSWRSAIAQCGLDARRKSLKYDVQDICDALQAYYDAHGTLPSLTTARNPGRTPVFPAVGTTLRAFDVTSWPEAMRRAASLLDIRGGRYGLPEKLEGAA